MEVARGEPVLLHRAQPRRKLLRSLESAFYLADQVIDLALAGPPLTNQFAKVLSASAARHQPADANVNTAMDVAIHALVSASEALGSNGLFERPDDSPRGGLQSWYRRRRLLP